MKLTQNTFGINNSRAGYHTDSNYYFGYFSNQLMMRSILSIKNLRLGAWETCKELATRLGHTRYIVYKKGNDIPEQDELDKIKDQINKIFPGGLRQLSRIPGKKYSVYFEVGYGFGKSRVLCHSLMTMVQSLVFKMTKHVLQAKKTGQVFKKCKGKTSFAKTKEFRKIVTQIRERFPGSIRGPVNFMTYYRLVKRKPVKNVKSR